MREMKLERHPLYPRLHDHQLTLAEALVAELPAREMLPFRADSKIGLAVVAAAETIYPTEGILVVCSDDKSAAAWTEHWKREGVLAVSPKLLPGSPFKIQVATMKDLSWWEEEHRRRYGLCVIAGLDDAQAGYVLQAVRCMHLWRLICQGEDFSEEDWVVGPCGQLLRDGFVWERPLDCGARSRPSALAERIAA
jgi:hypothetical protein